MVTGSCKVPPRCWVSVSVLQAGCRVAGTEIWLYTVSRPEAPLITSPKPRLASTREARPRSARCRSAAGADGVEVVAAVVRGLRGLARPGAAPGRQLDPRIGALAQGDVGGARRAGLVGLLALIGGDADLQVVGHPQLGAATDRHGVEVAEARGVFVAHHRVGEVAGGGVAHHQQVVARHR
ncbi:MAG: hypothetical protein MZV70_41575 [Desulfobacterales bacterium]|nr:hypothetical protein [Desulfobacterales bacterium]